MGIANNKLEEYLNMVCSLIKNKDVHNEIRLELKDHIETIKEENLSLGLSEEEAMDKALEHIGDANLIGKQLNKSHKAKLDLSILIPILFLCFFGLASMYFIEAGVSSEPGSINIFMRSLFFYIIGICIMLGLFFFDYRKLLPFSKNIYIGSILILTSTLFWGNFVNGALCITMFSFNVNFAQVSPFFIVIALAGIFQNWNWDNSGRFILGLSLMALPVFLILLHGYISPIIIYSIACLVLMIGSKAKLYQIAIPTAGVIFVASTFILQAPYRISRILTFLDPYSSPERGGYIFIQLKNAIGSAGFLGNGIGRVPKNIPDLSGGYIFTYFTYTFGWFAALVVVLLISLFLTRMIKVSKTAKHSYGKLLIKGISAILTSQFVLGIATNLGLSPIFGASIPFMSFGGSQTIAYMIAVGLILSVYRRKNLSPAAEAV